MKQFWSNRPGYVLFLLISYCLWGAVTIRWITEFAEEDHPLTLIVSGILLLFGLLMGVGPVLTKDMPGRVHAYLVIQTGLVLLASLFHYELDFFALLYMPVCGQVMFFLPRREGLAWLGILIAVTAVGQAIQFGGLEGLSFTLLYAAALVFVAVLVSMILQADEARRRSDQLLAELQSAHDQLRAYANQAEELAVANERTRLARDLHDSVAQTLYGLTLQAEAASRKLAAGQPQAVEAHLALIREDAQQTLQETRLLIFELRPPILKESGLAEALKARLNTVEARSGLAMHLNIQEIDGLPEEVETGLYRVAQEALNNVAKYARASELHVSLAQSQNKVTLEIADNGVGFDTAVVAPGSVGLQGMAERVEQMNGRLTIDSASNRGTKIQVEIPL
jgi:signal transduction histidine kinase